MKITISPQAAKWFKEEVGLNDGYGIRFKTRIYGKSPINDGFTIGIEPDLPMNPVAQVESEGILFFVEENDEWYFNGHDLLVELDDKLKEPTYVYLLNGKRV